MVTFRRTKRSTVYALLHYGEMVMVINAKEPNVPPGETERNFWRFPRLHWKKGAASPQSRMLQKLINEFGLRIAPERLALRASFESRGGPCFVFSAELERDEIVSLSEREALLPYTISFFSLRKLAEKEDISSNVQLIIRKVGLDALVAEP